MSMALDLAIIAFGGGMGAVTRYLVTIWAAERFGSAFPYGTLLVNVAGSFIIGLFMTLFLERLELDPQWRLFISVGFLGGLTTFSSFSYETLRLVQEGAMSQAFANAGSNVILCLASTWAGFFCARLW
ncbi:fluoride efflux transporter CrcB [Anaeromusa acidaminophila]|uniref:fluoride efflux transporter CrcB n=1 Tax=Anaeromusa acidaminophila TaxID=81464 RepID=UPI000370D06A|nr:fluoride efflux transporter CrcB [Anaeromusa acidaminophila]